MHDFKIEQARSASSIWNHKYDFRPKLHDKRFDYHFTSIITSIMKYSSNTGLGQFKYFIEAVLSWFEIKLNYFFGGKITVLETKVAEFAT